MLKSIRKFIPAYRELAKLGLPIFVGQLGSIAVSFADNIMVGHYSTDALASASFVNNLVNTAVLCCMGFSYGLTPLAGALFGTNKLRDIGALTRLALRLNVIFTLIAMAVMSIVYFNVHLLGQPEHLLPLIRPYFLLVLIGMLPAAVFNVFAQWSYSINNSSMPMWIILGANILNVCGNYTFIFGNFGLPELGLVGAGLSTLTARIVGTLVIIGMLLFAKRFAVYRDGFFHAPNRRGDSRLVVKTSFPVAMQMAFETGSFSIAAVMVGWLGHIPLASYQVFITVGMLGFCLYYSVGAAITVKVANAAGQGSRTQMRHMAWAGYHIILLLTLMASLIFIFGGELLIKAFTEDVRVINLTLTLIFPLVLYQLGDATQIAFANALRGTSHAMPMLWIAFFSYVVVGIPATYILGFPCGLGIYGVVLSFSVSLFLAATLFLTTFLKVTKQ